MSNERALVTCAALVAVASACDREVFIGAEVRPDDAPDASADADLPDAAEFPWSAQHEGGDLAEWSRVTGPVEGGAYGPSIIAVTNERAHGGNHAVKISITLDGRSIRYGKLYREGPMPTRARFSAWFYLPTPVEIPGFLNLVHFANPVVMLWDASLSLRNGRPELYLWNHVTDKAFFQVAPSRSVPIGRWFEVAILLERTSAGSRLQLFQDGERLVEIPDSGIQPQEILHFNVGVAANDVSPSPLVLYVDDVAITPLPDP